MRIAEYVVLTLWPPGPVDVEVSILRSFSGRSISTSSASGITATLAAQDLLHLGCALLAQQLLGLLGLARRVPVPRVRVDELLQPAQLLAQRRQPLRLGRHLGAGHLLLQLVVAAGEGVEPVDHAPA